MLFPVNTDGEKNSVGIVRHYFGPFFSEQKYTTLSLLVSQILKNNMFVIMPGPKPRSHSTRGFHSEVTSMLSFLLHTT